jgi:hypothetical protein
MAQPARSRFRFGLRGAMIAFVLLGVLFAYFNSYYRISRRGMREASQLELAGFLYVPFEEAAARQDLSTHHAMAIFCGLANWIDQAVTGAPGPVSGICWSLDLE